MDEAVTDPRHMIALVSDLLLFFGIAGVIVPLLQSLRVSPVLVYLFAGIMIGPHGLSAVPGAAEWLAPFTIADRATIEMLGELGIITLMFMIGLELSLERLREFKRYIFGLGTAQIVTTALVIFLVALWFGNSPASSVLVGASLALSSTAIVMKLLEERRLANRAEGTLAFSILLMQDLAVVPILVIAASLSGSGTGGLVTMIKTLALGAVTVVAVLTVGRRLLGPLLRAVSISRNAEWLIAFTVFFVVACATISHAAGLSLALGAFLAGLLISETHFRHEIETIIDPLKGLLLGVFFLSVGMTIDVAQIARQPVALGAAVLGIYAAKAAILFPLCLFFKVPPPRAAEVSVYLAQPGEFALLILSAALAADVMPAQSAQFFLLVTTLAMALTPLLFKIAPVAARLARRLVRDEPVGTDFDHDDERLVIIAGFGRVGELLGAALDEVRIPYIAFDTDAARVQRLKEQGFRVIYGDARKFELWQRLSNGRSNIIAAIIAIDNHDATHSILRSIRTEWPLLPIVVRAKDTGATESLYDAGADYVVAETLESSLRMARLVMEKVGTDPADVEKIVKQLWDQNAMSGH